MARFKGKWHGKIVGNFEKHDARAYLAMSTAQTQMTKKSSKQNEPFKAIFLLRQFFQKKIGPTIWCPDFCDGHWIELRFIADTLSYRLKISSLQVVGTKLWPN